MARTQVWQVWVRFSDESRAQLIAQWYNRNTAVENLEPKLSLQRQADLKVGEPTTDREATFEVLAEGQQIGIVWIQEGWIDG